MRLKTVFILSTMIFVLAGTLLAASNDDTFSKGIEEFDAGRWTPAADLFKKVADARPHDEVVRLTTGVALANVKRYSEAAEQFEWAVRIAPRGVVPLMLLDGTYTEIGNVDAARKARDKANSMISSGLAFGSRQSSDAVLADSLAKYSRNAIAVCLLGDTYQLEGRLEAAKQQYAKAAALAPMWAKPVFNLGLANLQSDPKTAEINFNRAIELDPSNCNNYLWLGDAYLKQKKQDKAIEAYRKAEQDKSLIAEAQTRIGNAQMQAGNYAAAQRNFVSAASNAPQDPRPLAGQAQIFENTGDLKSAESTYKQAGDILAQNAAPRSSQAVVSKQVAVVQSAQGRVIDAYQNYARAFAFQPTLANAIALVEADVRASTLPRTVASYEADIEKNPRDTPAMVYLLAARKLASNTRGALDMAERLMKADPGNAKTYLPEIGCAKMALGDEKGALDAFARAIEAGDSVTWESTAQCARECGALEKLAADYDRSFSKSNDTRTGKVLFELYSVAGDTSRMVATAEKMAKLAPDDVSIALRLGQAYERAGQGSDALAVYTKIASGSNAAAASAARARIGALKGGK